MKNAVVLISWVGCPRNVLLKLRLEDYLKANGYTILAPSQLKSCELVVFSSCGFTYPEQKRSLYIVKAVQERIAKMDNPPTFVVSGCLTRINPKELGEIFDGPSVPPRQIEDIDQIVNGPVKIKDVPIRNEVKTEERVPFTVERRSVTPFLTIISAALKTNTAVQKAYHGLFKKYLTSELEELLPFDAYQMGDKTWCITTSAGCTGKCSYCAIKKSKGHIASVPLQEIVEEAKQGIGAGYKWISLIADDNGSYGRDTGSSFSEMLKQVSALEGDFKILVDSLNADHFIELYDELIEAFSYGRTNKICLAIQHVNPRILNSMKRYFDVNILKERLSDIASKHPDFNIDAHFIVGYPGETEEEFQELADFTAWMLRLNEANSYKSFAFSPNPGTVAARLPDQVPSHVISRRVRVMESIYAQHINELRNQHSESSRGNSTSLMSRITNLGIKPINRIGHALMMAEYRIARKI